jgi:threonine dehydratase
MSARAVAAPTRADLDDAAALVAARLVPTPLVPAPALGDGVHLKLETFQPTGSFKVRGALAALARAGADGPVVTASAGNAGLGVAWAASALGVRATVVVAETASPAKVAALRALPVELIQHGADYDEAEAHALSLEGATYVSSYNDTGVIAGQSTIGRELDAQLPGPLTVAAPLGGGSLASGLGLWASGRAGARVVGVEAERSPAMSTALAAGRITPFEVGDTLADGLAGNLEPGSVTFELVRDHVADVVQATEGEIEEAIRFLARAHGTVAEGAGATAVAGVMAGRVPHGDAPLVVVVSGRNIALPRLAAVLAAA